MRTKFAVALAIATVCVTAVLAEWTPEAMITGDNTIDRQFGGRKMVFDPDGVGHLVWWNLMNGKGLNCNRYDPLAGWTPDYQVSPAGSAPSIALDADGTTIHLVYVDSTLCYQKCVRKADGSDEWGPVVRLYREHGAVGPSVASVPGEPNHVVVCWVESFQTGRRSHCEAVGFIEFVGGEWGTVRRLDSSGTYMRRQSRVSVAPNGDVFIAYFGDDDNTSGRQVYVKTRDHVTGIWGTTVDVTSGVTQDICTNTAVEANPYTGNPHVVFSWQRTIKVSKRVTDISYRVGHTYRNTQGSWQTPESVSVPRHGLGIGNSYLQPDMAFVSDGSACVVWHEHYPWNPSGIMYSSCSADGEAWSTPAWVVYDTSSIPDDACPCVAVDEAADAVHVAWKRKYSGEAKEIWWKSSPLGSGSDGGEAQPMAISQSVIELFPNPAKAGRVTVQYSLPRAEPLRVTLLDVSGRVVRSSAFGVRSSGEGSFSIDVSGLNAGVYVARLVAGDLNVSRSLVVER